MVSFNDQASSSSSPSPQEVSARKRRANRRNARKSTGPRTVEGKTRASGNAITHGIFAADVVVLDGESRAEFIVLQQAYVRRLRPQDLLELDLANRIVLAQWRLRRCGAAEGERGERGDENDDWNAIRRIGLP